MDEEESSCGGGEQEAIRVREGGHREGGRFSQREYLLTQHRCVSEHIAPIEHLSLRGDSQQGHTTRRP